MSSRRLDELLHLGEEPVRPHLRDVPLVAVEFVSVDEKPLDLRDRLDALRPRLPIGLPSRHSVRIEHDLPGMEDEIALLRTLDQLHRLLQAEAVCVEPRRLRHPPVEPKPLQIVGPRPDLRVRLHHLPRLPRRLRPLVPGPHEGVLRRHPARQVPRHRLPPKRRQRLRHVEPLRQVLRLDRPRRDPNYTHRVLAPTSMSVTSGNPSRLRSSRCPSVTQSRFAPPRRPERPCGPTTSHRHGDIRTR